jgi:hypothetical protein
MQLSFKQGIVRFSTSGVTPDYLSFTSNKVNVKVTNSPLIVTLSQGTSDYLHQESVGVNAAWTGPFTTGTTDFYLYIDLDPLTGLRTFGHTIVPPVNSQTRPLNPQVNLHWFNTNTSQNGKYPGLKMWVWNGSEWINKVRVFVGWLENGSVLHQENAIGSTAGVSSGGPYLAGFIVFDENDRPVRKLDAFNKGTFLTTESPFKSQASGHAHFKLETLIYQAEATENIAKFQPVCYTGVNKLGLAQNDVPSKPAIGISIEAFPVGEVGSFINAGYLNTTGIASGPWTQPPGTRIFVDASGSLTTVVPQVNSMQQVATVVDAETINVSIQPIMIYG